jgi:redox-sensitive bicupin YhaK (pirin superfamily)
MTSEHIEVTPSRVADVGGSTVRRALPRRRTSSNDRRTVGAWCFADHMGPRRDETGPGIGPHPHIGLQTVTWLLAGELLHRDSLGSEQTIRPGQLNLMTAGDGISHAEESTSRDPHAMHGIQLWVAQPEATRHGPPAFEHHPELPQVELGDAVATVLVGELAGASSTARRDTDHFGADVALARGSAVLPLRSDAEHAVVVLEGLLSSGAHTIAPGNLAYLSPGREELAVQAAEPTRFVLLGGTPFEAPVLMSWNFVARTREEVDAATADWNSGSDRFGDTGSPLARIPAPAPAWA